MEIEADSRLPGRMGTFVSCRIEVGSPGTELEFAL